MRRPEELMIVALSLTGVIAVKPTTECLSLQSSLNPEPWQAVADLGGDVFAEHLGIGEVLRRI